ncbi:MAG: hypothetical protein NTU88_07940, partial [Armatimonadetes bacterium]|nr:hypothetical protein [Armatimonadota bacterium]
ITLTLRNVAIHEALSKLADAGHFYITTPQPGQNNFLIIPDVKVTDANIMPGLSSSIGLLGDVSRSMQYLFRTLPKDAR